MLVIQFAMLGIHLFINDPHLRPLHVLLAVDLVLGDIYIRDPTWKEPRPLLQ